MNCEHCIHYVFDDKDGCRICEVQLDQDEMYKFLNGSFRDCPYFHLSDDYKIVKKQN